MECSFCNFLRFLSCLKTQTCVDLWIEQLCKICKPTAVFQGGFRESLPGLARQTPRHSLGLWKRIQAGGFLKPERPCECWNKHRAKFGKQWRPSCLVTSNSTVCLSQHVSNIPISDWQQYGCHVSLPSLVTTLPQQEDNWTKKHKNRGLIWINIANVNVLKIVFHSPRWISLERCGKLRPLHLPWFLLSAQFERWSRCKTLQDVASWCKLFFSKVHKPEKHMKHV